MTDEEKHLLRKLSFYKDGQALNFAFDRVAGYSAANGK